MENLNDLKKVSTYAKENNISVTWVYKKADKKEGIKIVEIDGVKFVKEI